MTELETLLLQIGTLMQWGGGWNARARHSNLFAKADTPLEACRAAIQLRDGAAPEPDDCSDLF